MNIDQPKIQQVIHVVRQGGVIAYPTEGVWGLGCDPWHTPAVQQILSLKNRPEHKGLILIGSDMTQFDFLLSSLSADQKKVLAESWPGPNTWLVPHHGRIPAVVHGQHDTVAIRVTAHPWAAALCEAFGGPLVSTSANPATEPPARDLAQARHYFGDRVAYAPGQVDLNASPSTIRDLRTGRIIRA